MSDPQQKLNHGAQYPYDANDDGQIQMLNSDWAKRAARGILADLTDRRGIKWGFENVDHETRCEIVEQMAAIIRLAEKESRGWLTRLWS